MFQTRRYERKCLRRPEVGEACLAGTNRDKGANVGPSVRTATLSSKQLL